MPKEWMLQSPGEILQACQHCLVTLALGPYELALSVECVSAAVSQQVVETLSLTCCC